MEQQSEESSKQDKSHQISWSQFHGASNASATLIAKAKALAPLLLYSVASSSESLHELFHSNERWTFDDNQSGEVFLEVVLFYIYVTDVVSFRCLGKKKADVFMDTLLDEFLVLLAQDQIHFPILFSSLFRSYELEDDPAEFHAAFRDALSIREQEYSKYIDWYPEEGGSSSNTLFWEFGKKLGHLTRIEKNALFIEINTRNIASSLRALNLKVLFSE